MSNKKVIKVWAFQSGSNPSKTYQTLMYEDNTISCECPGWTRRVAADGSRTCKHTRSVEMGMADTECITCKDLTKVKAQQSAPQTAAKPKKKTPKKLKVADEPEAIARKINW